MPRDARFGLVVGVTLVIPVAILFFGKEGASGGGNGKVLPGGQPANANLQTAISATGSTGAQAAVPGMVPQSLGAAPRQPQSLRPRTHTVQEGESLYSVSVRYYGDGEYVSQLFRANRERLRAPDRVPIGTVLVIPDLPGNLGN